MREPTGWGDTQLKLHLHKLDELEYLIVHRGGRGQSFVYELYFERPADPAQPFLPGLIDVASSTPQLRRKAGTGQKRGRTGRVRPRSGACPGVVRVRRSQ